MAKACAASKRAEGMGARDLTGIALRQHVATPHACGSRRRQWRKRSTMPSAASLYWHRLKPRTYRNCPKSARG
eukprot:6530539-Alexandrium_andersonii.AAC.1